MRKLALVSALITVTAVARAQSVTPFPVALGVVTEDGAAVVGDAWIDGQLAQANAIFAPSGVRFEIRSRRSIDAHFAAIETRSDRNALAAELHPGVVNVFVVRSLRDVDDPSEMRRGVHWRPIALPGAHFVIVSSIAGPSVLAHELGHFFGNRHSTTRNAVMSYDQDGTVLPFFECEEIVRIRRHSRYFRERGEIIVP